MSAEKSSEKIRPWADIALALGFLVVGWELVDGQ